MIETAKRGILRAIKTFNREGWRFAGGGGGRISAPPTSHVVYGIYEADNGELGKRRTVIAMWHVPDGCKAIEMNNQPTPEIVEPLDTE